METLAERIETPGSAPIKAWTRGVIFEDKARGQIANIARLPIVHGWVAVMPDVHFGIGATVGSVIPTAGAIIPAAVGVDIGCGMMAVRTSLSASDLPSDLHAMRTNIERAVPVGFGLWKDETPSVKAVWSTLQQRFQNIADKHPSIARGNTWNQLGTLGTGNHFIEVCLDEAQRVWFMLHTGSRGVGNRIGTYFIEKAREDMREHIKNLPDKDLAYFNEGTQHFDDYVEAVGWAQDYARANRDLMMQSVIAAVAKTKGVPPFTADAMAVNCHHNYVNREHHLGKDVWVTRKGAVRARQGELGIIPGSMGARSFIVRGKGNAESFESCSHGAGRAMSRNEAKRRVTLAEHANATRDVECRKDNEVIDETPAAYKPIDAVMAAQADLVEIVHELKQVVCVKG